MLSAVAYLRQYIAQPRGQVFAVVALQVAEFGGRNRGPQINDVFAEQQHVFFLRRARERRPIMFVDVIAVQDFSREPVRELATIFREHHRQVSDQLPVLVRRFRAQVPQLRVRLDRHQARSFSIGHGINGRRLLEAVHRRF